MKSETGPGIQRVFFDKPVLARNAIPPLQGLDTLRELHIEFSPDFMLNSLGICDWVIWLAPVADKPNIKIFLHKCSVTVVQQINLVVDFVPSNAEIMSFYVPFYSEASNESRLILLEKGKNFFDGKLNLPEVLDSRGEPMDLDILPKTYFQFLGIKL
jgi:hypothetical protein